MSFDTDQQRIAQALVVDISRKEILTELGLVITRNQQGDVVAQIFPFCMIWEMDFVEQNGQRIWTIQTPHFREDFPAQKLEDFLDAAYCDFFYPGEVYSEGALVLHEQEEWERQQMIRQNLFKWEFLGFANSVIKSYIQVVHKRIIPSKKLFTRN